MNTFRNTDIIMSTDQPAAAELKQEWASAVIECVDDPMEQERLVRYYTYDESVNALLNIGRELADLQAAYDKKCHALDAADGRTAEQRTRAEAAEVERDKHYSRLAGLLFSGCIDKLTGDDCKKLAAEYVDQRKRAEKAERELLILQSLNNDIDMCKMGQSPCEYALTLIDEKDIEHERAKATARTLAEADKERINANKIAIELQNRALLAERELEIAFQNAQARCIEICEALRKEVWSSDGYEQETCDEAIKRMQELKP